MLKNRKLLLMGAALAAAPAVSPAATITYQYYNVLVSTSLTGNYYAPGNAAVPGTSVTSGGVGSPTLTIPVGDYVRVGLEAEATGSDLAGGGIDSFGVGISDSNAAASTIYTTSQTVLNPLTLTAYPPSIYTFATQKGEYDGAGGVSATNGGTIYGSFNAPASASPAQGANGAGSFSPLFTRTAIYGGGAGTSVFTPVQNSTQTGFTTQAPQTQTTGYSARTFNPLTDTIAAYPTLTIITAATTAPTTTAANKIVSLLTTAPTTYGSQIGATIKVNGSNGSYTPGNTGANMSTGTATGYAIAGTFTPATDTEIYGLKLDQAGQSISTSNTTLIAAIISDINASESGVTASVVTATYQSIFGGGYDVLLTSTGATPAGSNGTAYLGIDFTADTTVGDTGITVTEVAAVPEPATAAGIVIGASGLLLGRRKNRLTVA